MKALLNGWMDACELKVLRITFEGIKVNEDWTKRYNKGLMQLFVDLDTLSFVRIYRLNWIGRVNRTYSKRKVIQIFNNNAQGIRLRGRPKREMAKLCINKF
jgi:hypothetical protein